MRVSNNFAGKMENDHGLESQRTASESDSATEFVPGKKMIKSDTSQKVRFTKRSILLK